MSDMNKVHIEGDISSVPSSRTDKNGNLFSIFSLASKTDSKSKDGHDIIQYYKCIAFNECATMIKQMSKGTHVILYGNLNVQSWINHDGTTRSQVNIVAKRVYSVSKQKSGTPDENDFAVNYVMQ